METPAEPKVEEAATVAEVVPPAVMAEATPVMAVEPAVPKEPAMEETKPTEAAMNMEQMEQPSKTVNFLTKIFASLKPLDKSKMDKKTKATKSPKKEKKEDEPAEGPMEPAKEEAMNMKPVKEEAMEPAMEVAMEPAKAMEPAMETMDGPVAQTEEVKEMKTATPKENKALKVGRRLSHHVTDLFRLKQKPEPSTHSKVDEHPPMISVAPAPGPLEVKVEEPAKPVDVEASAVAAAA
jgi:hypothetical protein